MEQQSICSGVLVHHSLHQQYKEVYSGGPGEERRGGGWGWVGGGGGRHVGARAGMLSCNACGGYRQLVACEW